eukprot:362044-Chlamydomonas_euryale.AAC.12
MSAPCKVPVPGTQRHQRCAGELRGSANKDAQQPTQHAGQSSGHPWKAGWHSRADGCLRVQHRVHVQSHSNAPESTSLFGAIDGHRSHLHPRISSTPAKQVPARNHHRMHLCRYSVVQAAHGCDIRTAHVRGMPTRSHACLRSKPVVAADNCTSAVDAEASQVACLVVRNENSLTSAAIAAHMLELQDGTTSGGSEQPADWMASWMARLHAHLFAATTAVPSAAWCRLCIHCATRDGRPAHSRADAAVVHPGPQGRTHANEREEGGACGRRRSAHPHGRTPPSPCRRPSSSSAENVANRRHHRRSCHQGCCARPHRLDVLRGPHGSAAAAAMTRRVSQTRPGQQTAAVLYRTPSLFLPHPGHARSVHTAQPALAFQWL